MWFLRHVYILGISVFRKAHSVLKSYGLLWGSKTRCTTKICPTTTETASRIQQDVHVSLYFHRTWSQMSFLRSGCLYPETSNPACRSSRSENLSKLKPSFYSATVNISKQACLPLLQFVSKDQSDQDPVGRPMMHRSAIVHATGEAVYCDDIPKRDGELFLVLVTSSRPHAKIT